MNKNMSAKPACTIFSALIFFLFVAVFLSLGLKTNAQGQIVSAPEPTVQTTSQIEVYLKDLVLDKTDYKAGDTVKGSFYFVNAKNSAVSNLGYRAFLVGDLMTNTLYKYEFDDQVLGTLFLDKNETKKVNFEYTLPLSSGAYTLGKQLGIKIRAFSGSGFPLGWTDTKVNISDSGITPVSVVGNYLIVNDKKFASNTGPMVYQDGKVQLKIFLSNGSDKIISNLTPKISIYDMDYSKTPLAVLSEKEFSINAKSKLDFTFDLPTFNYTPKVYAGEMVIVDENGVSRASPVKFRYIVYGEIVNIRNVVVDKLSAKKGETVGVKVDYSGTPYDITNFKAAPLTPSDFSLKLFNENNELVGEYSDKTTFIVVGSKDVDLAIGRDARAFSANVVVSKSGKIMAEYKTNFPEGPSLVSNNFWIKNWVIILVAIAGLFIVVVLITFFKTKNKKNK